MSKMQPFWWFKKPAIVCPAGEQIVNGGFETGDFTGWIYNSSEVTNAQKHSGNYSCFLGISPTEGYIEQDLAEPIAIECIQSCGCFILPSVGDGALYFTITYEDYTTNYRRYDFGQSGEWSYIDFMAFLNAEADLKKKIIHVAYSSTGLLGLKGFYVDDVSLVGKG